MWFGQNVLRMSWKERFVQFLWKARCFPFLKRNLGRCDDFENFDGQNCDLAKTCCACAEKSLLYNFYGKRSVFPFWREFQASVTIMRTFTLKNVIWPKRAAHELKTAFCIIFMGSALFFRFEENLRPVWRFWELWRWKMRFGQNVLRTTWKERFVQFSWKAHCFPVLKRIWGQFHDFENFDGQKRDLAKTCCAWPKKSVLHNFHGKRTVFLFWRNMMPIWGLWELWRSKLRFGQNVLRMSWKERFVQFFWKAHCFPVLARISGHCEDFENLHAQKCDLAKTAPHDLKRAFCTIFMESALFSYFEGNMMPMWGFWELCRSKLRFGQKLLRMSWKERFVQFWWKALCFPVLARILGQCDDFKNFYAQKCDLAKTCCAWAEKSVLYNFYEKRAVFPFWREI